jgi:hypothetical protein
MTKKTKEESTTESNKYMELWTQSASFFRHTYRFSVANRHGGGVIVSGDDDGRRRRLLE